VVFDPSEGGARYLRVSDDSPFGSDERHARKSTPADFLGYRLPVGLRGLPFNLLRNEPRADFEVFDYPGQYGTSEAGETEARVRLEELQALLPTVTATASIEVQQINLAAFGLKIPGLNPIVGPFQVVDFRAYLTQNLVNVSALKNYIAAKHNFAGAKLTAEDARDLVVLTVGNAYLLCIADAARIEAVTAELATSKISLDQAVANHDAGTSPRLDVLRAQVDYQNEQQERQRHRGRVGVKHASVRQHYRGHCQGADGGLKGESSGRFHAVIVT